MSVVLAFDTATAATVVGLGVGDAVLTRRDDPAPGARPNHAERLLGLCEEVLAEAGAGWGDVSRIGVGIGPGTFTGLRIGVATGRALAQATGVEVVPVSTLAALAGGAPRPGDQVLTLIDARRGEVFAASWTGGGVLTGGPVALAPDRLAEMLQEHDVPVLAIGDGAVRYRAAAEAAGAVVPPDEAPEHRVHGHALVQVARAMEPVRPETLVPDYLRLPDAEINRRPAGVRP